MHKISEQLLMLCVIANIRNIFSLFFYSTVPLHTESCIVYLSLPANDLYTGVCKQWFNAIDSCMYEGGTIQQ